MAEAKTQAVGAVGAALLTGSGVAVAVGIYEAQEHHSAVGWFTCSAVCLIAGILIPVITFMFLPWVEYLGKKQTEALRAAPAAPNNKISPRDRTIINVTPRFLVKMRKSYKTDIEAEAALQRYIGKWMQVSGKLDNMSYGSGPDGKQKLFVHLVEEDAPTEKPRDLEDLVKRLEYVKTTLIFTDQKWIDEITTFNRTDKVVAIGNLNSIDSDSIALWDCDLIKNQVTIES